MSFPIVDASNQLLSQWEAQCGRAKAIRTLAWYRIVRPTCVTMAWISAGSYVQWCIANASAAELSAQAFMPGITGIAVIAAAMTLWTFARHMERRLRRTKGKRGPGEAPLVAFPTSALVPVPGRCMIAYHDDDGLVSHVTSLHDRVSQLNSAAGEELLSSK
jgi:hypothetical protein